MPITVRHDAVGGPILASYATGVGQAQERRRQESLQWQQQQQRLQMEQARLNQQAWRDFNRDNINVDGQWQDRDIWKSNQAFALQNNRLEAEEARADRRNEDFRNRDYLTNIQKEVAAREKWLREKELTPEGRQAANAILAELGEVRRGGAGARPEQYGQWLNYWMQRTDEQNPNSWLKPPADPMKTMRDEAVYYGPNGEIGSLAEFQQQGIRPVMVGTPDRNGTIRWKDSPKESGGGLQSTPEEYFRSMPAKDYQSAYGKAWAAVEDKNAQEAARLTAGSTNVTVKPDPVTPEAVEKYMRDMYESQRRAAGYGQQQPTQQPAQQQGPTPEQVQQQMQAQQQANLNQMAGQPQYSQNGAFPNSTPTPQAQGGSPQQQAEPISNDHIMWAQNAIQQYRQFYPNIQSLDDIKNAEDRNAVMVAMQILQAQQRMASN